VEKHKHTHTQLYRQTDTHTHSQTDRTKNTLLRRFAGVQGNNSK